MRIARISTMLAGLFLAGQLAACASAPPAGGGAGAPSAAPAQAWPVKHRDVLDLWLHGFAMLSDDTTKVPYFTQGYRDNMVVMKNQQNISSLLDTNRQTLRARFAVNPGLVNAQFLGLYFGSWEEMKQFFDLFFRAEGDPSKGGNPTVRQAIATLAGYFPGAADRNWARTFVQSLDDEHQKFYRDYWSGELQRRGPALAAVDSLWQQTWYPKMKRFLDATQQRTGDMILSMPLNGEGRSLASGPRSVAQYRYFAVKFPAEPTEAVEAVYVFAHEAVGTLTNLIVSDNTTPAEARDGVRERYESDGLVVGGYFLLKRVIPELADGYARYYLRVAGQPAASGAPEAALLRAFPLPANIRESIIRQIDTTLGGI